MLPGLPGLTALLGMVALSQLKGAPALTDVLTPVMVRALPPEVEMITVVGAVVPPADVLMKTGFGEALSVALPPPPLPEPLKTTVTVTGATLVGGMGVRVTLAEDPWLNPDAVRMLKLRLDGVVAFPLGAISHPAGAPVVSWE
jgi:hypothetical protein